MSKNPIHQIETALHDLRSPKRAHTFWGFWAVLALTFVLLYPRHGEWLHEPNRWMLSESTDGFKNYMTTAWHVKHDSSYMFYRGMNYPFGEHILFTDMQPAFAVALQWWSRNVSDISGQTVGLMNLFLFVSLLLGAGVLFLVFRKLHLPVWYAGLVSVAMLFLSPQQNRLDGHFGLSHTWVIPMLLLLLSSYEERYSRRYQSLLIGILVWVSAQIHFYYFGMCALFLGLYTAWQLALDPSARNFRVRLSHLVVMVLVPFALLNLWIHWANFATDRPANPAGFTGYVAYLEGVFLPYKNFPEFQWINTHINRIRNLDFEAQQFTGTLSFLFTLYLLFSGFKLFGKSWSEAAYHRVHKSYMKGILAASMLLLLFSFGIPFIIPGLAWTVDYMGPIKQFRGLGRFVWPFYYVVNIIAFYVFWNLSLRFKGFKGGKALWFKWVIILAPLALLVYEAWTFQRGKELRMLPNLADRNTAAPTPDHWLNKVDFSKYQALFPIPYNHIGSENVVLDINYFLYKKMFYTALHTGVPDMGVNMSRTPLGQTLKSIQLSFEPGVQPDILDELPDNRPIALMIEPQGPPDSLGRYRHLIAKSTPVYDGPEMQIRAIEIDSIRAYQRELARAMHAEAERNSVYNVGNAWKSDRSQFFYTASFDSLDNSPFVFKGKGALETPCRDTLDLWNAPLPKGKYLLSAWFKADKDMGLVQRIRLLENSLSDGRQIVLKTGFYRDHLRQIVNGWALLEMPFEVSEDHSKTRIYLLPKSIPGYFYMDELMLRPEQGNYYRKEPGWTSRNNYWYKTD